MRVPSKDTATRGSRLMLRIFWCSGRCAATSSSPSTPTQTHETCGLPSRFCVTRCASAPDSISSRALSGSAATPALDQAAIARRVGPRVEPAARPVRALGGPHLLERCPVVGGALEAKQRRRVRLLKMEIHLQSTVVRRIRIAPRALVAMDAEPRGPLRDVQRTSPHLDRELVPRRDSQL